MNKNHHQNHKRKRRESNKTTTTISERGKRVLKKMESGDGEEVGLYWELILC